MITVLHIPIRIYSINKQLHWSKRYSRNKKQSDGIRLFLNTIASIELLPCKVTLTRIGPRSFDLDNLIASLKSVRDTVASALIPGLAPGQADGDSRIQWDYGQRKGGPKEYGLEIRIEKLDKKTQIPESKSLTGDQNG